GHQVGGGGRDHHEISRLAEADVRDLGHAGPGVGGHRLPGQRRPGDLADEAQGIRSGHDPDLVPGFGQQPEQLARLIRGDARADTEDDAGRHGTLIPYWPSMASTLSIRSLISRSEMDSGFSWLRVSTSGPTYSSRPSPSCE